MLQLPAVVRMQAHWRGYSQWKKYNDRLQYFRDNEDFVIKVSTIFLRNLNLVVSTEHLAIMNN